MKEFDPIQRIKELIHIRRNEQAWKHRWDFPYAGDSSVFAEREKSIEEGVSPSLKVSL